MIPTFIDTWDFHPVGESNSPLRHKDFDDSIVTNIYDFFDMYANGRDIPVMKRSPQYDENADKMFRNDVDPPEMAYDMLDALDDSLALDKVVDRDDDDSNDDDAVSS